MTKLEQVQEAILKVRRLYKLAAKEHNYKAMTKYYYELQDLRKLKKCYT